MRTSPLSSAQTSAPTTVSDVKTPATKSKGQMGEIPMGPSPQTVNKSISMPGLLIGLAAPVVAAVLMAGLFSGPAIGEGAPLQAKAAQSVEVRAPERPALTEAQARLIAQHGGGAQLLGADWKKDVPSDYHNVASLLNAAVQVLDGALDAPLDEP